jgi:hypothetical protein
MLIYLYNIHGGRPFHPSKFLILEEEDDGRERGGRRMATATIYPNVYLTFHWLKSTAINFWLQFSPS